MTQPTVPAATAPITPPPAPAAASGMPTAPALNTPEGIAARQAQHPVMRGDTTYTEPQPPQPTSTPSPAPEPAPTLVTPQPPQVAPAPAAPPQPYQTPGQPAEPQNVTYTPLVAPAPKYASVAPAPATAPPTQVPAAPADSALALQMQQMQDTINAQAAAQAEQQRKLDQERLFQRPDLSALGSIPEDQAAEIYDNLVAPQLRAVHEANDAAVTQNRENFQSALDDMRTNLETSTGQLAHTQQQQTQQMRDYANAQILAQVPDIETLMQDPAFLAAGSVPLPGSTVTPIQELQQGYAVNDPHHVIEMAKYIQAQASGVPPQPASVEAGTTGAVPAVGTAAVAPAAGTTAYTYDDMKTVTDQFRRREIDKKEYMAFKNAFDQQELANIKPAQTA